VVADVAHIGGTVRYFDPDYRDFFAHRIDQIVAGICQSYGADYHLDYTPLYPPVINDGTMADLVRSVALAVVETPAGIVPECHTMGGEDMAFFLQEVPGCYFFWGLPTPKRP
jgi:amidohydrolase